MSPRSSNKGDRDDLEDVEDLDSHDEDGDTEVEEEPEVDDVDGYDDDEEYDEGDEGADELETTAPATMTGRLGRAFTRPSRATAARDVDSMTDKEKAAAIRQIDSTERRVGVIGALLTLVISLLYFVPYISNPRKRVTDDFARVGKHCPKGWKYALANGTHQCVGTTAFTRSHWIEELLIALLFAVFIAVATWYGRRSLVAFSLLFGGLAVVSLTGSILGILYIGAGGWLMVRAYRVQKYGTTNGKEVAAIVAEQRAERKAAGKSGGTTTRSSSRSSTAASKTKTTSGKSKKAAPTEGKSKPQANKRYTPKTPPRRRPVPPSS